MATAEKIEDSSEKKSFVDEESDEQKRKEFVAELEKKGDRPIVFRAECGIKNNLRNEYGRAPRGVAGGDEGKGRATEKMNLIAGLLDNKMIAPLAYDCYTNTEVFNPWLKEGLIPILPQNSIIVLDNARFHKSEETKKLVEAHGHQLLFLPPYSPDLNPIEKYWALIKRNLRNLLEKYDSIYHGIEIIFKPN